MSKILIDITTGIIWPKSLYRKVCLLRGMTPEEYEVHINDLEKNSQIKDVSLDEILMNDTIRTEWTYQ